MYEINLKKEKNYSIVFSLKCVACQKRDPFASFETECMTHKHHERRSIDRLGGSSTKNRIRKGKRKECRIRRNTLPSTMTPDFEKNSLFNSTPSSQIEPPSPMMSLMSIKITLC